jgi:hypothetical protein
LQAASCKSQSRIKTFRELFPRDWNQRGNLKERIPMKTIRSLIVALLAASPVAFAQVSGNLNAAGGATNRVLPPTQPPAGAGANAAGAAGVNADRPLPADPNAAANVDAAGQTRGPNADAAAQVHGLNAQSSGAVSTALSPPDTIRDIQSTTFDARKPLLNEVSDRIDAGNKLVDSLKHDPKAAAADTSTEFKTALDDVSVKEKILKRSLKEARNASNADAWTVAQPTLAADYEAYATAVEALNVTVGK